MTTIKSLRKEIENLKNEIDRLDIEARETQRQLSLKKNSFDKIKKEIENLESGIINIKVTDHCLVRYLQRIEDYDFNVITNDICNQKIKSDYIENGDGKYFNDSLNCFVCIRDGVVITLHFADYDIKEEIEL